MLEAIWKKAIFDEARENLGENYSDKALGIIFSRAYEDGHSAGYNEVYEYFKDYADMIGEFMKEVSEN